MNSAACPATRGSVLAWQSSVQRRCGRMPHLRLHALTNRLPFDEANGAAVGGSDGEVEGEAEFGVGRRGHVVGGMLGPRQTECRTSNIELPTSNFE